MKKSLLSGLKLIAGLAILASFTSCAVISRYKYGIKDPDVESLSGLMGFLEKNDYPLRDQYFIADSSTYKALIETEGFRKNLLSFMIFDRQGRMLAKDTTRCQWAGNDVIRTLHNDTVYRIDTSFNFSRLEGCISPFGICRCPDVMERKPDFVVVITWGKFLGRYNYRLFDLNEAIIQNRSAVIRTVWLNIDMQKLWNLKGGSGITLR
jgi:hypothetical protein